MSEIVCKGAWALGTACGHCPRCRDTALEGAVALQAMLRDARSDDLWPSERAALWNWHHDCEIIAAAGGHYSEAQSHKNRLAAFADPVER